VVQAQVINSSQASGTGGSDMSWGVREFPSVFHPMVSGGGRTDCCKWAWPAARPKPGSGSA